MQPNLIVFATKCLPVMARAEAQSAAKQTFPHRISPVVSIQE
jgi:hypothetical protein